MVSDELNLTSFSHEGSVLAEEECNTIVLIWPRFRFLIIVTTNDVISSVYKLPGSPGNSNEAFDEQVLVFHYDWSKVLRFCPRRRKSQVTP